MIGTYASAALICLASLLVGRATFSLAGRREWCWLEPAVGVAAILTVSGILAPAPRPRASATSGRVAARVRGAGGALGRPGDRGGGRRRAFLPLRGHRPLGAPRRRLQQRPRASPRLGGVAAQRRRPGTGPRLPARPARA